MNLFNRLKDIPLLGNLVTWLGSRVNRHRAKSFYTYRVKPKCAILLVGLLRRLVNVPAITISRDGCIVDSGGARFYWNPGNPYSLLGYPLRGEFERLETEIMRTVAAHSRTVVDIGGNFGWYACNLRGAMPPGGELHVFEPVPSVRRELEQNLALNPCVGVETVVNGLCLSDAEGNVTLHVPKVLGSAFASIEAQNYEGGFDEISVQALTLDQYCRQHGIASIDLLKIDVEGAELKVLKGARELISGRHRPVIFVESETTLLRPFGCTVREVIQYVLDIGYVGYLVANGSLLKLTMDNIGQGYDYIFVDPANRLVVDILEPLAAGR